jgi:hypothetical protein
LLWARAGTFSHSAWSEWSTPYTSRLSLRKYTQTQKATHWRADCFWSNISSPEYSRFPNNSWCWMCDSILELPLFRFRCLGQRNRWTHEHSIWRNMFGFSVVILTKSFLEIWKDSWCISWRLAAEGQSMRLPWVSCPLPAI